MHQVYRSVPLDEEQSSLDGFQEKRVRSSRFDRDAISKRLGGVQKHWMWLAHAVLLSISITLFTLSICAETASPSAPGFLQKIATYCKSFDPLVMVVGRQLANIQ
jgi:hypothetical protein